MTSTPILFPSITLFVAEFPPLPAMVMPSLVFEEMRFPAFGEEPPIVLSDDEMLIPEALLPSRESPRDIGADEVTSDQIAIGAGARDHKPVAQKAINHKAADRVSAGLECQTIPVEFRPRGQFDHRVSGACSRLRLLTEAVDENGVRRLGNNQRREYRDIPRSGCGIVVRALYVGI